MLKFLNKQSRKIEAEETMTEPVPCDICGEVGNNYLTYYNGIGMTMCKECYIEIGQTLVYNKRRWKLAFLYHVYLD